MGQNEPHFAFSSIRINSSSHKLKQPPRSAQERLTTTALVNLQDILRSKVSLPTPFHDFYSTIATMAKLVQWSMLLASMSEEQQRVAGKMAGSTMELADLPRQLSLSTFLSPVGGEVYPGLVRTALILNGQHLHSTHLILLALNEECRGLGQGAFYHVPLRSKGHESHPCDIIYLPDKWSKKDKISWDAASWVARLEMCRIGK